MNKNILISILAICLAASLIYISSLQKSTETVQENIESDELSDSFSLTSKERGVEPDTGSQNELHAIATEAEAVTYAKIFLKTQSELVTDIEKIGSKLDMTDMESFLKTQPTQVPEIALVINTINYAVNELKPYTNSLNQLIADHAAETIRHYDMLRFQFIYLQDIEEGLLLNVIEPDETAIALYTEDVQSAGDAISITIKSGSDIILSLTNIIFDTNDIQNESKIGAYITELYGLAPAEAGQSAYQATALVLRDEVFQ